MIGTDVLEAELRSLPGIVGVTIDDRAVSVLVPPDTDGDVPRVLVNAVLAIHAIDKAVRVLGGTTQPVARRRSKHLVTAAAGVLILFGAAVAGSTGLADRPHASDGIALGQRRPSAAAPHLNQPWVPPPGPLAEQATPPSDPPRPAPAEPAPDAIAAPLAQKRDVAPPPPKSPSTPLLGSWTPTGVVIADGVENGGDRGSGGRADQPGRRIGADNDRARRTQDGAAGGGPRHTRP